MTLLSPADEQQDARIRDLVEFTERNRMREVHTLAHTLSYLYLYASSG